MERGLPVGGRPIDAVRDERKGTERSGLVGPVQLAHGSERQRGGRPGQAQKKNSAI